MAQRHSRFTHEDHHALDTALVMLAQQAERQHVDEQRQHEGEPRLQEESRLLLRHDRERVAQLIRDAQIRQIESRV